MKKFIATSLILAICLLLCSCGGNNAKTKNNSATITIKNNDSYETVEMTAEDLFNEFDSNEARFNKLYKGATIEFTGIVKNIKVGTSVNTGDGVTNNQNKIVFEEGWCLILGADTPFDLANYTPGMKLTVRTGIVTASYDTEFLQNVADNNRVVWLIGNDTLFGSKKAINRQTTTIEIAE